MFINAIASIAMTFLGQASAQPMPPMAPTLVQVAHKEKAQLRASKEKEKIALKELAAKEKADIRVVKADKTLTPMQLKEKIAAIRKDCQAKRKEIKAQGKAERQALK